MHHVVIDTNILSNNTFDSMHMKILKRLIDNDLLKLYIPDIVKKEYLTQELDNFKSKLNTKNINDVNKFFVYNNAIKDELQEVINSIKKNQTNIEDSINSEFEAWINDYKIEILEFDNSKMTEVMDNYFTGNQVFKNIKNREDIPDSMICTIIEEFASQDKEVIFLSNDNNFRKYLDKKDNIKTFNSSYALIETEQIQKELATLNKLIGNYNFLSSYLCSDDFQVNLLNYLINNQNNLEDVYEEDIDNTSILGDVYYCNINGINTSTIEDLRIKNVELIDDNEYALYVNFYADATLMYGMEYYNYMQLEKNSNRNLNLENMKGDGGCSIAEDRYLEFDGVLSVFIKDIKSDNTDDLINYDDIEFEVHNASIQEIKN